MGKKEFGGSRGALGIMIFSHIIPLYLVLSLKYALGGLYYPQSFIELMDHLKESCCPTWIGCGIYFGFLIIQLIFAALLPGVEVRGLPIPKENHRQYRYYCNALSSWYLTLFSLPLIHSTNLFRLTLFVDHFGSILSVSMIFSDILSFIIHFYAKFTNQSSDETDSFLYDFFMGIWLNPRLTFLGRDIDLKLLSEARLSWLLLFLISVSCATKQYEVFGNVSWAMKFLLIAHFLYVNACMKGEECIVVTWDIFHEKWGWMLIFWNLSGVPFVYAFHSHYILINSIHSTDLNQRFSFGFFLFMCSILFISYYIWDSSLAQKINFRMRERGIFLGRKGFPQMPWSDLKNPKYLKTTNGDSLLIDGWWKFCRKPAYTADIVMSILWALSCSQWNGILPYFYPTFFFIMIIHRYTRDLHKCREKYGEDWNIYCQHVPSIFLPGLI